MPMPRQTVGPRWSALGRHLPEPSHPRFARGPLRATPRPPPRPGRPRVAQGPSSGHPEPHSGHPRHGPPSSRTRATHAAGRPRAALEPPSSRTRAALGPPTGRSRAAPRPPESLRLPELPSGRPRAASGPLDHPCYPRRAAFGSHLDRPSHPRAAHGSLSGHSSYPQATAGHPLASARPCGLDRHGAARRGTARLGYGAPGGLGPRPVPP